MFGPNQATTFYNNNHFNQVPEDLMDLLAKPLPSFDKFYVPADPEITPEATTLLTQYSGIPEDKIVEHVRAIRDKAWSIAPYPCIGQYRFLAFSISSLPQYPSVLERLKNDNETLLDLGCCFGQDIRKLVFDGAPASNISGSELEAGFVQLGYDLFLDKDKLESKFTAADFFDTSFPLAPGGFDMVHAGAFFHLFSWPEQVEAVTKALRLLKPKAGSMLFGRQTGVEVASVVKHPQTRSGEIYQHNLDSWKKVVEEVREKLEGKVKFESEVQWTGERKGKVQGFEWTRMDFCLRIV